MEKENIELQKKSTELKEKYYDEKKKWSAQNRALENENATLKATAANISTLPATPTSDSAWASKFHELEKASIIKSREVNKLVELNLFLENSLVELQSKSQNKQIDLLDSNADINMLRKENSELASLVRKLKKTEDHHLCINKNQQLLESEIIQLKSLIQLHEVKIASYKQIEQQYLLLKQERSELCELFKDIITNDKNQQMADTNVESITAQKIYALFGQLQSQYAVLMKAHSELKCKLVYYQNDEGNHSRQLKISMNDKDAQVLNKRLDNKILLLQQQLQLLESENKRLKNAIDGFDDECAMIMKKIHKLSGGNGSGQIGSFPGPDIIAIKNNLIKDLEMELVNHRQVLVDKGLILDGKEVSGAGHTIGVGVSIDGELSKKRKLTDTESVIALPLNSATTVITSSTSNDNAADKDTVIADLKYSEMKLRYELELFHRLCGVDVIPYVPEQEQEGGGNISVQGGQSQSQPVLQLNQLSQTRV